MVCELNSTTCPAPYLCPEGSVFVPAAALGTCFECEPLERVPPGLYCTGGNVKVCPTGYYCPYSAGAAPIECPEGYICREGYASPVACGALSSCPAGALTKGPAAGFIGILAMMLISTVAALWLIAYVRRRRSHKALSESEFRKQVTLAYGEMVQAITGSPLVGDPLHGFNEKIKYRYPVSIEFKNLGMTLKSTGQVILDGVSGQFPPGSLVAVLGGSGAGKSTFLNALANRAPYGKISGQVTLNRMAGQTIREHPRLVGFVPQDDIMHDDLTVYENLLYSARLRLPPSFSLAQKKAIVEDVLEILDLVRIRNSVVGSAEKRGISGGQKKRVSIGIELVAYPRVLFLDEPTSGLDSAGAMKVARCLQKMRSLGITVVSVIHQPRWSVFRSFSHCLLLAKGGKTAYLGPTNGVQEYFEKLGFVLPQGENVADWIIDILEDESVKYGDNGLVDSSFDAEKDLPSIWAEASESNEKKIEQIKSLTRGGTRTFASENERISHELQSCGIRLSLHEEIRWVDFKRLCKIYAIETDSDRVLRALYQQIKNSVPTKASLTIVTLSRTLIKSIQTDNAKVASMLMSRASPSSRKKRISAVLEPRASPSFLYQVSTFFSRNCAKLNALDVTLKCIMCGVGAAILAFSSTGALDYVLIPLKSLFGLLLFAVFAAASFMYVFGDERLVFSRESETGLSVTAYWLAKNLVNLFDLALITLYYYTFYFAIYQLDYPYENGFLVFILIAFFCSGVSHLFSVTMGPSTGLLLAVMVPAVAISVLSGVNPTINNSSTLQVVLYYASIGLYTIENLSLYEYQALPPNVQDLPAVNNTINAHSYSMDHINRNTFISIGLGVLVRLLTLGVLLVEVYGWPWVMLYRRLKARVILYFDAY